MAQITQDTVDFASRLSKDTGLNFYTVLGWEAAEGGPADNPLNIGPGQHFGTPVAAADASAKLIEGSSLYSDIRSVAVEKFPTQDKEIVAESHTIAYNPHWNVITGTPATIAAGRQQYYTNIESNAIRDLYMGIQPNSKIGKSGGATTVQNPPDNPGGLAGLFDSIGGGIAAIGNFFGWIANPENWYRIGFFVLGIGLAAFGLYRAIA